jgi:hypothetical protein
MTIQTLEQILKNHSIPYYKRNNKIFVDSMVNGTRLFEEVHDVTLWTRTQLFDWLGY